MNIIRRNITPIASVFVLLAGGLAAAGWFFGIPSLTSMIPGFATMKFNSAICFMLCAVALLCLDNPGKRSWTKQIAFVCSFCVLAVSLLTLTEYILGRDLGIDELLWKSNRLHPDAAFTPRMSFTTALLFVLISLSLLFLRKKKLHFAIQVILILILLIAVLATMGSLIREDYISGGIGTYYRIAFSGGLSFLALCLAIYSSYPLRYIRFSFQKRVTGYFLLFLLMLVIIFFLFTRNSDRFNQSSQAVDHTHTVLMQSQQLLSHAQDIETGRRGFIITGKNEFLEPYNRGLTGIKSSLQELKGSVSNNPVQRGKLDTLEILVQEKINLGKRIVALRRSGSYDTATHFQDEIKGKQLMDSIRVMVAAIQGEENDLLREKRAENRSNIETSYRFSILLQVLLLVMIISVFILIYNNSRQRNKAEAELKRSHHQLQHILDTIQQLMNTSSDVICTVDEEKRFVQVSAGCINLWGYTPEEMAGKYYIDMIVPEDKERTIDESASIRRGNITTNFQNHYFRKDGTTVPVSWTALWSPEDRMTYAFARDMTEKKMTAEELARLNKSLENKAAELQASNTELERFAYVASHDLQEPLRMVSSFLELLEKKLEGKLDDGGRQYIHFAVDGAERMKKLIQDLLQYSRVGTTREANSEIDCNEILDSVRKVFELSMHETNAELHVQVLPKIKGVKSQVLQLFQNLVGNALKYSGNGARVEVGCTDAGRNWQFYIKDNGIGIEPRFFEKIFVIFQRLHNKSEYSGTGIGLAICKKIVDRHGGKIWVESIPGKGSTFYVALPK